jgi:hypothetical protein
MRIACIPMDNDIIPERPLWPHRFGIGPATALRVMVSRLGDLLATVKLAGIDAEAMSLAAIYSIERDVFAWSVVLAGSVCLLPLREQRSLPDRTGRDYQWMVLRVAKGIAQYADIVVGSEAALAEACKLIAAQRIEHAWDRCRERTFAACR